jgi:hypothetical protein
MKEVKATGRMIPKRITNVNRFMVLIFGVNELIIPRNI